MNNGEPCLTSDLAMERQRLLLPDAPASERGSVKAWNEEVAITSYLPAQPNLHPMFLKQRVYQGSCGDVYPLPFIDRIEMSPTRKTWHAIHLENRYLRLMVLPEIGGRIHVGLDKTNGYDFFYRQNVIKPALVGLTGPWISGGVEFNWPQHHRPATYLSVETEIERHPDGSVTVWCSDYDRASGMKGMHGVCLHPDGALIELKARLYNATDRVQTFLWWANVAARVNEHYQSFFPPDVRHVADHAKRAISTFPLADGMYYGVDYKDRAVNGVPRHQMPSKFLPAGYPANDLSRYANIPVPTSYMIVETEGNFFGGYDHGAEAGFIHVANPHIAPGKKQWTWGNHEFGYAWDRCLTDDGAPYVELMAGVYTDNQPDFSFLAPGETKTFSQFWYPIRRIGIPVAANVDAALRFSVSDGIAHILLSVTFDLPQGCIELRDGSKVLKNWHRVITVEEGFAEEYVLPDGFDLSKLNVVVTTRNARMIRYSLAPSTEKPMPALAVEPKLPDVIESADQLYLTGLHLQQYRHATRSPEPYWREAVRRDPGDVRCNHALAKLHLERGQFTEAELHLRRAISRATELNPNPYDGEVFYSLGLTLRMLSRTDEAYAAFYKATWNAAWSAPAYFALAQIDMGRHEWESAEEHLQRALSKNADDLNCRNLHVSVLRRLASLEKADAFLAETRALDRLDLWSRFLDGAELPKDGYQLLALALLMERSGMVDDAIEVLHLARSATTQGAAPLVLLALARCCESSGQDDVASQYLQQASDAPPDYCFPAGPAHLLLLQFGLSRRPDSARLQYYLGCLLYHHQRLTEAIAAWELCVQRDSPYAPAWRNLGIAYFNVRGDAEAAKMAFRKAMEAAPQDARILYEQDQLQKRLGLDPALRLETLLRHRSLVDRRDNLCVELATLLNQNGRPQEALDVLLSRQFQPWEGGEGLVLAQYVAAHLRLGQQALKDSRTGEALDHFTQTLHPPTSLGEARHLLANDSQTYFWIGEASRAVADESKAVEAYQRSARQIGDFQAMSTQQFSEMTYWSGLSLKRLGRHDEAEQLFRRMLEHVKNLESQDAEIDYFATSLPTLLLFEESLENVHAIKVKLLRGCALMGLGELPEARELFEEVMRSEPHCTCAVEVLEHGINEVLIGRRA